MSNKKLKFFLLAIFSVVLVIIYISVFSSNKNETLHLSKNINKFKLITHPNEKFNDKIFSNHPSLIFFGFLNCPDVCPFTLTKISEIIYKLKDQSDSIRFYFVTVDPEKDKWVPKAKLSKIKKKFSKYKNCSIDIYPSTDHGFAFPERNTYVKEAAEIHWKKLIQLFDKNLKKL